MEVLTPPNKIGFGAFLILSSLSISLAVAKSLVKIKRFENTSSTKLELQVLLFALTEIDSNNCKIIVYTDSQNIIGLPGRREGFEKTIIAPKTENSLPIMNCIRNFTD